MKKFGKTLGIILLCVIGVFALLVLTHLRATRMVFWNWVTPKVKIDTSTEWQGGETYLKVPYSDVSESDYLDLYVPSDVENPPLYVVVHGGGFITNDSQSRQARLMYSYFRDHGFAVATVNYRLAQEAAFPACLQDVKASVRFLRANAGKYGYDADRIAIFGESAGGYLACMAAFTDDDEFNDLPFIGEEKLEEPVPAQTQVLVNYYGAVEPGKKMSDFQESGLPDIVYKVANSWLQGDVLEGYPDCESFLYRKDTSEMTDEERDAVTPAFYAEKNLNNDSDLHVWTAHGNCDMTVPIQQSQRLTETLKGILGEDKVTLEIVDKAGHAGERMYTDEELAKVEAYMRQYLEA